MAVPVWQSKQEPPCPLDPNAPAAPFQPLPIAGVLDQDAAHCFATLVAKWFFRATHGTAGGYGRVSDHIAL
jgi:hypothetical protein